jgi:hypothetical protein
MLTSLKLFAVHGTHAYIFSDARIFSNALHLSHLAFNSTANISNTLDSGVVGVYGDKSVLGAHLVFLDERKHIRPGDKEVDPIIGAQALVFYAAPARKKKSRQLEVVRLKRLHFFLIAHDALLLNNLLAGRWFRR